jgi:electron transport complex protein RnfG
VLAHKETPGLGDYIDIGRSDWIKKNFDGRSLAQTPEDAWRVKKDGGQFDYMTGATITPRAVIKAVHRALTYFAAHRDELLSAPASKKGAA